MKVLLDTNVFLWASREPHLLTSSVRAILSDPFTDRFVSVASAWEMQIKHGLGKLILPAKADEVLRTWSIPLAASILTIEPRHIGKLYDLPLIHRDPFDRMLIAQALSESLVLVSSDQIFHSYPVQVIG